MYEIFRTNSFKKDYKKLSKSDKEILKPDLLLIYRIHNDILELALTRVGSHSKLFKK